MKKPLLLLLLIPFLSFSQDYYSGTEGLSGYALKTKLSEIISSKTISWHYGDLTSYFGQTDLDVYYDHDASNTTFLLDIYSENPTGPDSYEYTVDQVAGSASAEGIGWNREHMVPQSTFYSNYPMYSDLFFVIPTDARINQLRSNYPYGVVGSTIYYTFTNGSRIGNSAIPGSSYTGRVYEPIDEFKGDIARALLYYAVRYERKLSSFNYFPGTTVANDTNPMDGTMERAFDPNYYAMLRQWHLSDPVSQKEIDRNNTVFTIQKNRNPFIDHPEWVDLIWMDLGDTAIPATPSNLQITKSSAYFVDLSWSSSTSTDVLGYRVYQDGVLVATVKNSFASISGLNPSSSYNFTVKAYDKFYFESAQSNTVSAVTLSSDVYAKDLIISKYLEGSANNKAIEITNKTGLPVNLDEYRLSIQFRSGTNYYFPDPFEFEGMLNHNESFVVIHPDANFSCFNISQARFVTAAPQLTFNGSNYLELRRKSATVDVLGTKDMNNSTALGNKSLYRFSSVTQPNVVFTDAEWQVFPSNYCQNLGVLAAHDVVFDQQKIVLYPNPVADGNLFAKGDINKILVARIYDVSGKLVKIVEKPFVKQNFIDVSDLQEGVYLLVVDGKSIKFLKK